MRRIALDDVFAADIRVARRNCVLDVLQGDAVALHPCRVRVDLVAFDGAAEAANVGDARQAPEQAFEREILQRFQVVQAVDLWPAASRGLVKT